MRANVRPNGRAVTEVMRAAAKRALVEVAEDAGTESDDLVPKDQGDLLRSREVTIAPDGLSVAVTYDTPYAVAQHEDPTLNHPRGGEAFFLEKAVEGNADRYFQHIADAIRNETS